MKKNDLKICLILNIFSFPRSVGDYPRQIGKDAKSETSPGTDLHKFEHKHEKANGNGNDVNVAQPNEA